MEQLLTYNNQVLKVNTSSDTFTFSGTTDSNGSWTGTGLNPNIYMPAIYANIGKTFIVTINETSEELKLKAGSGTATYFESLNSSWVLTLDTGTISLTNYTSNTSCSIGIVSNSIPGALKINTIETTSTTIRTNGTTTAPSGIAYNEVTVEVPVVTTTSRTFSNDGTYTAPSGTAYNEVIVSTGNTLPVAEKKAVNFVDYDGTIRYSYTILEFLTNQTLPSNPTHDGLTAQGWNLTVQQILDHLTYAQSIPIYVGQHYVTTSGNTELDIYLESTQLTRYLNLTIDGTIIINWGDGTATTTLTGNGSDVTSAVHTWAEAGGYTISISVVSGEFDLTGGIYLYDSNDVYTSLISSTTNLISSYDNMNCQNILQRVRLGSNANIGNYAFYDCKQLESITIPSNIYYFSGTHSFDSCRSLEWVTLPSSLTSIGSYMFNESGLKHITLPPSITRIFSYGFSETQIEGIYSSTVTHISERAFAFCECLAQITFHAVTEIGASAFTHCAGVRDIEISDTITSLGESCYSYCYTAKSLSLPNTLTTIPNQAFAFDPNLVSVTIPSSVTSIGTNSFQHIDGLQSLHFTSTTPPTIQATSFSAIPTTCVIYVPRGYLSTYQSATNYSYSFGSNMWAQE